MWTVSTLSPLLPLQLLRTHATKAVQLRQEERLLSCQCSSWALLSVQGVQLEPDLGSLAFLALVGELLALSHVATVGLSAAAARVLPDLAGDQYHSSCAIGFSAVLFALKVVLSYRTPGWSHVAGFELPTKVCNATHSCCKLKLPLDQCMSALLDG